MLTESNIVVERHVEKSINKLLNRAYNYLSIGQIMFFQYLIYSILLVFNTKCSGLQKTARQYQIVFEENRFSFVHRLETW